MNSVVDDTIAENAYIEVQEYLLECDEKLTTADVTLAVDELSLDMAGAARHYTLTYAGDNPYVADVRKDLAVRDLTPAQVRGVLNVLLFELRRGDVQIHAPERIAPLPIIEQLELSTVVDEPVQMASAVHKGSIKSRLDISSIPDGRYAVPATADSNDYVFVQVTTLKRPMMRVAMFDAQTGRNFEELPTGTVEVRTMHGDAKRLIGYQRPQSGYEGQSLQQLIWIMERPKIWAIMFSKLIGKCSLCGKTLTDNTSRDRGIGPECFGSKGLTYWKTFQREVNA